jgi:hypothetical protein
MARLALLFSRGALVLGAGCVKHMPPDASTGEDGTYDGAEPLELDATGQGDTRGTVSYPGGDRVDWVSIELPAGKSGTVAIDLSWESPRVGGDLSFKVYDGSGELGGKGPRKEAALRRSKKKRASKSDSLGPTGGTVYVEVYASRVADAGKYHLKAAFTEIPPPPDLSKLNVPLPGTLAMVPLPCDVKNPDPENPECDGIKPPCTVNCGGTPAKVVTPCPSPAAPDRRYADCKQWFPVCDEGAEVIDRNNPWCDNVPPHPLVGTITSTGKWGSDGTEVMITLGSDDGLTNGMSGALVDASHTPVEHGRFKIDKVKPQTCRGRIKMREAAVSKYTTVLIELPMPPAPPPPIP